MTADPNRPEPTKPFKSKNWKHIHGSCKLNTLTDEGVKKKWQCPGCGMWSQKAKCPSCGVERPKKTPARAGKGV